MKPDELEIYITGLLKERRPDIKETERNRVIRTVMRFCKTKETATAFINGMSS